jgi:integrase
MATLATFEDLETTCLLLISRAPAMSIQRAVFEFLYNTGCRIEEAIQLKRITLGVSTFEVDTQKNSNNRIFPLVLLPPSYLPYLPVSLDLLGRQNFGSYTSSVRFSNLNRNRRYFKADNSIPTNIFRYRYAWKLRNDGLTVEQIRYEFGHISTASTLNYLSALYY